MSGFIFKRRQRPIRFAWRTDAQLNLTALSKEFDQLLGPQSAQMIGLSWQEICRRINLAQDEALPSQLYEQQSFAGAKIMWPSCQAHLVVPVDLSAQAQYDESGNFSGFSGFGIIRSVQAIESDAWCDPCREPTEITIKAPDSDAPSVDDHPKQPEDYAQFVKPNAHDELEDEFNSGGLLRPDATSLAVSGAGADYDIVIPEPEAQAAIRHAGHDVTIEQKSFSQTDSDVPLEQETSQSEPSKTGDLFEDQSTDDRSAFQKAVESAPDAPPRSTSLGGARSLAELTSNIVRFVDKSADRLQSRLSKPEQDAFHKIARALSPDDKQGAPNDKQGAYNERHGAAKSSIEAASKSPVNHASSQQADSKQLSTQQKEHQSTFQGKEAPVSAQGSFATKVANSLSAATKKQPPQNTDNVTHVVVQRSAQVIEEQKQSAKDLPAAITQPIDPKLLEVLPIGVIIVQDQELIYGNESLLKQLGYSSFEQLKQAGGLEAIFVSPEDAPVQTEGVLDRQLHMRCHDGLIKPIDARMHSVPWQDGQALMISLLPIKAASANNGRSASYPADKGPNDNNHGSNHTILASDSARALEAETDLGLSYEQLSFAVHNASDAVLILDTKGHILAVNRSGEGLFDCSRDEMLGSPLAAFLEDGAKELAAHRLDSLGATGIPSIANDRFELELSTAKGNMVQAEAVMAALPNEKGASSQGKQAAFACLVLRDMSRHRKVERALAARQERAETESTRKSEFLTKVSHEIRTPLNALLGFAEAMLEEQFGSLGNDRYREYLRDILRSGAHISALVNDLLDLARIEAGHLDLSFEAVSTGDILRECVGLLQPVAQKQRVIIRSSVPENLPAIVADTKSMRQIIFNLLSNALKFTGEGGQVIASLRLEEHGEMTLSVRDTGCGMSENELELVMQPFHQIKRPGVAHGTGLGLPLTKALAQANHMEFKLESEEDMGTVASLVIPPQRVLAE